MFRLSQDSIHMTSEYSIDRAEAIDQRCARSFGVFDPAENPGTVAPVDICYVPSPMPKLCTEDSCVRDILVGFRKALMAEVNYNLYAFHVYFGD